LSLNYEPINLAHDIELSIGANEKKMVIFCWLVKMVSTFDNILLAPQFRLLNISCSWVGMGNNVHTILYVQYTYWVCVELGLMPPTSYVFQPLKISSHMDIDCVACCKVSSQPSNISKMLAKLQSLMHNLPFYHFQLYLPFSTSF